MMSCHGTGRCPAFVLVLVLALCPTVDAELRTGQTQRASFLQRARQAAAAVQLPSLPNPLGTFTNGTASATDPNACHPRCDWDCGPMECNNVCRPVCQPPKCMTTCPKPNVKQCLHVCKDPQCAVVCAAQTNHTLPPNCTTVCNDPKCELECTQDGQGCETTCDDPVCSFSCKPKDCPEPDCQLKCQKPPVSCAKPPAGAAAAGAEAGSAASMAAGQPPPPAAGEKAAADSMQMSVPGVVAWHGMARVPASHLGRTAQTTPVPTTPSPDGPPYAPGYAPAEGPAAAAAAAPAAA